MKRMSRPEAMPLVIHDNTRGGSDIFRTLGSRRKRVPKSLTKSTGLESYICPHRQSRTSWYSSCRKPKEKKRLFKMSKFNLGYTNKWMWLLPFSKQDPTKISVRHESIGRGKAGKDSHTRLSCPSHLLSISCQSTNKALNWDPQSLTFNKRDYSAKGYSPEEPCMCTLLALPKMMQTPQVQV